MAQAASPLQTAQMEVGATLRPHFFRVRCEAPHNPGSLLRSVTPESDNKGGSGIWEERNEGGGG